MFKYSLIVTFYNLENYVKLCLDSILSQTYTNFEIICVDDGSNDNTLEILDEYQNNDSRIKLLKQENLGVSVARNNGLKEATGDYIWFIDGDDYIDSKALEKIDTKLLTEPDMIVFEKNYKDKYSIFPSYKFVNSKSYKYLNEKESKFFDIIKAAFEDIDICVFAWNKIIKHNFIKQNKILFIEGCTHGEDSLFILQLLLKNPKIYITDDILYYHVISRESSVTNIDSYNYFKQLLIFKNNLLKIFANMSVGTKENTIFNYMVDFLILLVLDLWRNIYFTRHRKEYLKELASYQEFFNNTNDNYINAIRLKKHLLMAKFHISWWYWKIIRPLAKYCIVIPYRKAKRYSRKIFNMKQNKKEI